jgi:cyclopropane fatty-acyl-phospholipid synthase-like methyltransferase
MMEKVWKVNENVVAQYYDNNTKRFLRFGKHKGTQNIHQALWAEGITDLEEAANYTNTLILKELNSMNASSNSGIHVLDLGCGVGGSLDFLVKNSSEENRFEGITISALQANLAQQKFQRLEKGNAVSIRQGDFLHLPSGPPAELAYAIEAFVHAADAQQFFTSVSTRLQKGSRLILIDDFRTSKAAQNELEKQLLHNFQQGWHANSLITPGTAETLAKNANLQLIQQLNLTSFLKIGRPRDKAIGLMIRVFGRWMRKSIYFQSLTGGYAKQQCIRRNLVNYQMLIFEKKAS